MGSGDYIRIRDNFLSKALNNYGVSVTYTPVTKVVAGDYGDEAFTDGTTVSITVYITRQNKEWLNKLPGEFEKSDLIMLTKYDQAISKDDKIAYNDGSGSRTYRVDTVLDRTAGEGKIVYKVCSLFLIT